MRYLGSQVQCSSLASPHRVEAGRGAGLHASKNQSSCQAWHSCHKLLTPVLYFNFHNCFLKQLCESLAGTLNVQLPTCHPDLCFRKLQRDGLGSTRVGGGK